MTTPRPRSSLWPALAAAALLGGCRAEPVATTGSTYPIDLRTRHPIVLAEGERTLDVFPTGIGHLDPRQAADLDAFLLEFRRYGRGRLGLQVPQGVGPALAGAVARTAAAIRGHGALGGLPPGGLAVAAYPVANPNLAAPLRLSFERMQASVAGRCGLWPQDLGVSDPDHDAENRPQWNLGCATQSNVAAQIADPIDLVRGRPEGRIDGVRRTQNLENLRAGKDPSTQWRQDGKTNVKEQVAQ